MIEKDKTYTYEELFDIIAKASAKATSDEEDFKVAFVKLMDYSDLMSVLFTDKEKNKELFEKGKILKEDKEN